MNWFERIDSWRYIDTVLFWAMVIILVGIFVVYHVVTMWPS